MLEDFFAVVDSIHDVSGWDRRQVHFLILFLCVKKGGFPNIQDLLRVRQGINLVDRQANYS